LAAVLAYFAGGAMFVTAGVQTIRDLGARPTGQQHPRREQSRRDGPNHGGLGYQQFLPHPLTPFV
jgi:hypothetical protein